MEMLNSVMGDYLQAKIDLKNKAKSTTSRPSIDSVKRLLPDFFRGVVSSLNRSDLRVDSSIGQGRIADVPWVRISNINISKTATQGYYIVLLFSAEMDKCYLSLNQAFTEYEKIYKGKAVTEKMAEIAKLSSDYLNKHDGSTLGPISLGDKPGLVRGYENGAIISFCYYKNDNTSLEKFTAQFNVLLKDYDSLFSIIGKNLDKISIQTESNYQNESLKIVSKTKKKSIKPLTHFDMGGVKIPPKIRLNSKDVYGRNPMVAAAALDKASFKCEVNTEHKTFISNISNENFVEAHHLVPMSRQDEFIYSLDIVENVISLCPCCHRLLHHASLNDKKHILKELYFLKSDGLEKREIFITLDELFDTYKNN